MKILLTNDDGYQSLSYQLLANELQKIHEVVMVSPEKDCSGISHAFTLREPVFITKVKDHLNPLGLQNFYSFSGTPVDCVKFCLLEFLKDDMPDLVISGINPGANMGCDVMYSGTVAAAMEAWLNGVSGVAVSYHSLELKPQRVGEIVQWLIPQIERLAPFLSSKKRVLNINYPALPPDKILGEKITTVGSKGYSDSYMNRKSPHGRDYFWLTGTMNLDGEHSDADKVAVEEGYVSISPLQIDFTNRSEIEELQKI